MEWWTGGYFKAANHRVFAPPDDQRNHIRCGVYYFSIPNDNVHFKQLTESPVLQRAKDTLKSHFPEGSKTIDAKTFSRARVSKVGKSKMYKEPWGKGERLVEVIGELLVLLHFVLSHVMLDNARGLKLTCQPVSRSHTLVKFRSFLVEVGC